MKKGTVWLIGAGPGEPSLITVRGKELIQVADVIVYDRLASNEMLLWSKPDAVRIDVGKQSGNHPVPQEKINQILIDWALEGKNVARLKGGDPFLFGRGGEEALSLSKAGISFEIVPGVPSAIAVPAYAGIPVTHRGVAGSVHIITGHHRADGISHPLAYDLLAKLSGTLVFLMGLANLPTIAASLIANGKPPDTMTAVIEKGTTGNQRVVSGPLKDIAEIAGNQRIESPAVIVIGDVVNLSKNLCRTGEFQRPCAMITRAEENQCELENRLQGIGLRTLSYSVIEREQIDPQAGFCKIIEKIKEKLPGDTLAFTSPSGVKFFFARMNEYGVDIRLLAGMRVAAIGKSTAAQLAKHNIVADFIPSVFTAKQLGKELAQYAKDCRVILARAENGSEDLPEALSDAGIAHENYPLYRTVPVKRSPPDVLPPYPDCSTFLSGSAVTAFCRIAPKQLLQTMRRRPCFCIGTVTGDMAKQNGFGQTICADEFCIDGLVEKIQQYYKNTL